MYLSHQNPEKGYSILEFARPKIMAKDTIQVTADEESKLKHIKQLCFFCLFFIDLFLWDQLIMDVK